MDRLPLKRILYALLFVLMAALPAQGQTYLASGATPPSLPDTTLHPFLYFYSSERDDIKAKKDLSYPYLGEWYDYIQAKAHAQGSGSSDAVAMAFYCAMTDSFDTDPEYFTKPRNWIYQYTPAYMASLDYDDDDNLISREARSIAAIYDFIYEYASAAEKDSMEACLVRVMNWKRERYSKDNDVTKGPKWPWFFSAGGTAHNDTSSWTGNHMVASACVTGLLAITLNDAYAGADTMLQHASMWIDSTLSYYVRNGPFFEGLHYGDVLVNMGLTEFLVAYSRCNVGGTLLTPFTDDDVDFDNMLYHHVVSQQQPDGRYYGTGMHSGWTDIPVPVNEYWNVRYDADVLPWWRALIGAMPNATYQQHMAWAFGSPENDDLVVDSANRWRFYLPYILYDPTIDHATAPAVSPTVKFHDGAVFRDEWGSGATMVGAYGAGSITSNKGTSDILGWSMYAHGARLSTRAVNWWPPSDPTWMSTLNYGEPIAGNVIYPDTRTGNMLDGLIDFNPDFGRLSSASYTDTTTTGDFFDTDFIDGITITGNNAYTGKVRYNTGDGLIDDTQDDMVVERTWLFVSDMNMTPDNSYLIVADKVEGDENHSYKLLTHFSCKWQPTLSGRLATGTNDLPDPDAKLAMYFPVPFVADTLIRVAGSGGAANYMRFVKNNVEDTEFLCAYYPYTTAMATPVFDRFDTVGAEGFTLDVKVGTDSIMDVCYVAQQATAKYAGLQTDGRIAFRRYMNEDKYSYYTGGDDVTYLIDKTSTLVYATAGTFNMAALQYNEDVHNDKTIEGVIIAGPSGATVQLYDLHNVIVDTYTLGPDSIHTVDEDYGDDTTPPDEVTGMMADPDSTTENTARLYWHEVEAEDCAGYIVVHSYGTNKYETRFGGGVFVDSLTSKADTTLHVSGFVPGIQYTFGVFPFDGESAPNYAHADTIEGEGWCTVTFDLSGNTRLVSDRDGADNGGVTYDTFISEPDPTGVKGSLASLQMKKYPEQMRMSFVQIDLNGILPLADAEIDSAKLNFWCHSVTDWNDYIVLYRVEQRWADSLACYEHRGWADSTWSPSFGIKGAPYDSIQATHANRYYEFDVTALIDMVESKNTRPFGYMNCALVDRNETANNVQFKSSDATESNYRPELRIFYSPLTSEQQAAPGQGSMGAKGEILMYEM